MQLVDDEFVPWREPKVIPLPVEGTIADDCVAHRIGHLAGIGVDALELALLCRQQELVLVADLSLGCVTVPVTVFLRT